VKVPAPHALHVRSVTGVPNALTYEPISHTDHEAHLAALTVMLNVPLKHPTHARSATLEPSVNTL
jgi:hypothetical protein